VIHLVKIVAVVAICYTVTPLASGQEQRNNSGPLDRNIKKKLSAEIVNKTVELRGSIHQNPKSYYEVDGNPYYYEHSISFPNIFRVKRNEPVRITEVDVSRDFSLIKVTFSSSNLGKGEVRFSSPTHSSVINRQAFDEGFRLCFKRAEDEATIPLIIGNQVSSKYHVATSNHLPPINVQVEFFSETDAVGYGLEPCLLCFRRQPVISNYRWEREIGEAIAKRTRLTELMSFDQELNDRAKKIGHRVLNGWPIPLQGYNYEFYVIDDLSFNAAAAPTGFIFINRGLFEFLESDIEIEGILAHEIAHVERRHTLRIITRAQNRAAIAQGVGAIVGALLGGKSRDVAQFGDLAVLIANSVDEGYPRSMEEEADAVATIYLEQRYGKRGIEAFVTGWKKLVYDYDYTGGVSQKLHSHQSHPLVYDRIAAASSSKLRMFEEPIKIVGTDKLGNKIVEINLVAQRNTTPDLAGRYTLDQTQVLGNVMATSGINKRREFKDITLMTSDGRRIKLDNKEDSLIGPYEDQGIFLRGEVPENLDELVLASVDVNIPQTDYRWSIENQGNQTLVASGAVAKEQSNNNQIQNSGITPEIAGNSSVKLERSLDWYLIKKGMSLKTVEEILGPPNSILPSSNGGSKYYYSRGQAFGTYILIVYGKVADYKLPDVMDKWYREREEFLEKAIILAEKEAEEKRLEQKRLTADWSLIKKGMPEAEVLEAFGTPYSKIRSSEGGFIWYYTKDKYASLARKIHIRNGRVISWTNDLEN